VELYIIKQIRTTISRVGAHWGSRGTTLRKDRKTHKTFTVNWLAKRRAKLLEAVQTRKRKRPQAQAQIELLDSENDNSGNESASANINGANESGTELSDNEND
jgi:hypothetical protein